MSYPTVFISYSRKDEIEKNRLLSHLSILHGISIWSDDKISAGADWKREIDEAISQADVAILLITANFLSSDFILRKEIPILLKRRQEEGMTIVPIVARACAWEAVEWLQQMNVRPKNARPVWGDGGSHVDEDLATIVKEIAGISRKVDEIPLPSLPKQRIQIYMQGDFSSLSKERQKSAIDAFAVLMGVSQEAIEVYGVYASSIIFDLGVPPNAVQRLRFLLQSNTEQLLLLRVEKVKFGLVPDEPELINKLKRLIGRSDTDSHKKYLVEEWVNREEKFDLETTVQPITTGSPRKSQVVRIGAQPRVRVLIVDDHTVVRKGIQMLVNTEASIQLVGEAKDGQDAVQKALSLQPDVILMDIVMPKMDGIEATIKIKSQLPDIKIIILTTFEDDDKIRAAMKAGVDGYLLKDMDGEYLLQAIWAVQQGEMPLHPRVARFIFYGDAVAQQNDLSHLTQREREVLQLIARDLSNKQIAEVLTLSEGTTREYISNILGKLNISSQTEAGIWAKRILLISPNK